MIVSSAVFCRYSLLVMSNILTSDDLGEVIKVLRNEVVNDWMKIGLELNLRYSDLAPLRHECNSQTEQLRGMLNLWLTKAYNTSKYGLPTWRSLAGAIESPTGANNRAVANKIRVEKISQSERY